MEFVILTGLSGAGKTNALHAMEDNGFYCVDNLPPLLLDTFYDLCENSTDNRMKRVAVVADARSGEMFAEIADVLQKAKLDGRRFHGAVSLIPQGSHFPCWRERGEVMLRDYGLSGIVVFDLSRRCAPGDAVELDMAPNLSRSELQALMDDRGKGTFRPGCLDGVLDPDLAALLERLSAGDPQRLIDLVKAYRLTVTGTVDAAHAQVMSGGLSVGGFTAQTLEAKSQPGFFACGEDLDVDADCGGFNLQWAWSSALMAADGIEAYLEGGAAT